MVVPAGEMQTRKRYASMAPAANAVRIRNRTRVAFSVVRPVIGGWSFGRVECLNQNHAIFFMKQAYSRNRVQIKCRIWHSLAYWNKLLYDPQHKT
jgi:hypothetical protein